MATTLIPPGWEIEDSKTPAIPDGWEVEVSSPKPKLAMAPPPPARPPLPDGLMSNEELDARQPLRFDPKTGESFRAPRLGSVPILDAPVSGFREIVHGVEQMASPGLRSKAGGASKIVRGAMEASTPLLPAALAAAPLKAAVGLGAGMAAQTGTEAGLRAVGVPEEYAALASDVVAVGAGGAAAHRVGPKPAVATVPTRRVRTTPPASEFSPHRSQTLPKMPLEELMRRKGAPGSVVESRQADVGWWQDQPETRPEVEQRYEQLFDQAEKRLAARGRRNAQKPPAVPRTGVPEGVSRATDARERLAQKLTGKKWDDLGNSERIAVDDLITEGYGKSASIPDGWEVEKPTSAKPTVPETPSTMKAQVGQLASGDRRAVMFPKGTPLVKRPAGVKYYADADGNTYFYNPKLTSQAQIDEAISGNRLPDLLGATEGGMGAPDKTALAGEPVAVVGRTREGLTTQATAADAESLPEAVRQTEKLTPPEGKVTVERPEVEIGNRKAVPPNDPQGSWVVVSRETGKAVLETFDPKKVAAVNREKYDVLPAEDYLIEHNQRVKDAGGVEPPEMRRADRQAAIPEGWEVVESKPLTASIQPETPAVAPGAGTPRVASGGTLSIDEAGRTAPESRAVPEPRRAANPVGVGSETVVRVPGGQRAFQARYSVRELDDVHASHNPHTYERNPNYQLLNDRNYADPANAERIVKQVAEFDPEYLLTESPDSGNGAPVIDDGGNVLGGNSRTMTLQRVYDQRPEGASAYRRGLIERAQRFGLDPQQVASMKRPVLVREIPAEEWKRLGVEKQQAITDLNKTGTAALTAAERSTADARGLSQEAIEYIGDQLEATGPTATLVDALTGKRGAEIINRLVDEGIFTVQEKPELIDARTGIVTAKAKDRISKALLGQFFRDGEQLTRTDASIRNKLERMAAPLMRVRGKEGWDLLPDVRQAIDLLEYARAHDVKVLSDVVAQQDMFGGGPEYSPRAVAVAEALREKNPNELTRMAREYSIGSEPSMFEERTPEGVFADVFGVAAPEAAPAGGRRPFGSERGSLSLKPVNQPTTPAEIYAKQMIAEREAARQGPISALATRVKQAIAKAKAEGVDSTSPILDTLKRAQKEHGYEVRPTENIEYNIDRALRATSIAEQFVKDNGLDRIIRDVEDVDYLDQYLIAKHAQQVERLKNAGKPPQQQRSMTGRDLARDAQLITEFRNKTAIPAQKGQPAKTYDQVAREISAYSNKVLDYSVEAGAVNKDLATALKAMYPDYVPLNRVFSAVEAGTFSGPSSRAVASLSKQTIVQMLEGSEREIENPLWSMLDKTRKAFEQGERNKAAAQLASYRSLPGFEGLIEPSAHSLPEREGFSAYFNGEKQYFKTTPEIAAAAKSLDVHSIGLLGKIFAAPGRLMKLGTTGINLPFVASNVVSDQLHTLVTSRYDKSLANPGMFFKAMMAAVKHDDLWSEVVRSGAGFTSFDQYRGQPKSTMRSIRGSKDLSGGKDVLRYITIDKPAQLFRQMEDIVSRSEEFGRARVYGQTKEALMKQGRTEADAKILAALEANNSLPNYMRAGAMMRPANAIIPYLNAGVQGSRSFLRSMERSPVKTAASIATTLYFPVAMATLWNLSDPERKKAYQDIQNYEKDGNIVILLPGKPSKDKQNRYDVLKFKLPPGLNQLTIPLRRAIEAAAGLDPVKFGEVAQAAIGSVSPVEPNVRSLGSTLVPQAMKPAVQAVANYDFFRDKPKVPGRLQDLPSELQVTGYTSGTAKKIAGAMGASPIKTEEFIKDTLGGIGSQVLNASDRLLYRAGKIPESDIGGTSTAEAIGARFSKARGGELANKEFELKKSIETEAERKAVAEARKTPYFLRLAGNEEMANRYLASVAARARNQVQQITLSPRYRKMETDQKLAELQKLKARLAGGTPPTRLYRPIPTPIVPPSQRSRYDLSSPGPIQ